MPLYKRCGRCGQRIPEGTRCKCYTQRYKEYDRLSRDKKSKQFYDSKEWMTAKSNALDADDGIDVYMYMMQGEIVRADTVHHIIPLRDDWSRRTDINNLMSLSHDSHSLIHQLYKKDKQGMQQKLSAMVNDYRQSLLREGRSKKF